MADKDPFGRMEMWARRHPLRIGDLRLSLLVVRIVQRFLDVRITGLAALLWLWLSGMAILAGAVVNAELARVHPEGSPHE